MGERRRSERNGWRLSWTVKLFGVSWNSRSHLRTADLPGGWSWHEDGRYGAGQWPASDLGHEAPAATLERTFD